MSTESPVEDRIDSTFEETDRFYWAVREFRGTHGYETARVVREYVVERGNQFLEGIARGYVDDQLVSERTDWWAVDLGTDTAVRAGTAIETFCRDHHFTDPEADIEHLYDRCRDRRLERRLNDRSANR